MKAERKKDLSKAFSLIEEAQIKISCIAEEEQEEIPEGAEGTEKYEKKEYIISQLEDFSSELEDIMERFGETLAEIKGGK